MDSEQWKRVEELFHRVVALSPEERLTHLEQISASDPQLRREVETLLERADRNETFLDSSPLGTEFWQPQAKSPELKRGDRIHGFEILGLVGRGGMGDVYRALDSRLNREIALKVRCSTQDPRRFEQEARALAALRHPNVVPIYEFDHEEGIWFLVEELVEGTSLEDLLRKGPVPLERCLQLGAQIAAGLAAAHPISILHRDLKPANVMLTADGDAKILDFGLAKSAVSEEETTVDLTREGTIVGTAAYMSPEQASGKQLDTRSDIFSFGSSLYEMITGPPFYRVFRNAINCSRSRAVN
jgi:eukaryotic-like serine/threonine-protein kinase